jgi:hypothetical protein
MTDRTPAAQTSEPRTAAGRRLHARIFGLSDRMPDGAELDNLILAIEAEAAALPAAPAELDRNAVADALNRAWLRSTDAQFGGGRPPDLADHLYDALSSSPAAQREPTTPELETQRLALRDLMERLPSEGKNGVGAGLVNRNDVLAAVGHFFERRPVERRDIDLIYMDGYLAGRDAPDWRDDDHVLRLAERYAAAYRDAVKAER